MTGHPYLLTNAETQAGDRFRALSALFDATTFDSLSACGIAPGWRCWEAGAGGLTVPNWMAARTTPHGRVIATDIDISWLGAAKTDVEVKLHDVAAEAPPADDFHLAHARLVLSHVPAREEALRRMVQSLRPGGSLVIEDFDVALQPLACLDDDTNEQRRANTIRAGFLELLRSRGVDLGYGHKLVRLFREVGLVDVRGVAAFSANLPACLLLEKANVAQTAPGLIARGLATEAEINTHLVVLEKGELDVVVPPLFTVYGRKP
jgi:SAM-dependent methyltransferase